MIAFLSGLGLQPSGSLHAYYNQLTFPTPKFNMVNRK